MKCTFCGATLPEGECVCHECGNDLKNQVSQAPIYVQEDQKSDGKTMGLVGMILGIVSLVLCLTGCCSGVLGELICMGLSLTGLILGIKSNKCAKAMGITNGMAVASIILGAIGLGIAGLLFLFWLAIFIITLIPFVLYFVMVIFAVLSMGMLTI